MQAVAIYSIRDLEQLSGVKAHTIRAWEQRYGLLDPKRTDTNIRYYDDQDLKFLLKVALLRKHDFKISAIADMGEEEINHQVDMLDQPHLSSHAQLDALTISTIEMDEMKFNRIISTHIDQMGFERTMLELIYPFLEKLSLLYFTGSINPVQEAYIGYLVRQKLICAIDREPLAQHKASRKFIIYLPQGERQELSLLLVHYLLRKREHRVVNIGMDITLSDLKDACSVHQPDYIFTLVTESFTNEPLQQYIDRLCQMFPATRILVSGYQVTRQNVSAHPNLQVLPSLDSALQFLETIRESTSAQLRTDK